MMTVPRLSASVLLSLTEKALRRVESSLRLAIGKEVPTRRSRSAEVRRPKSMDHVKTQPRSVTATSSSPPMKKLPVLREIGGLHLDHDRDVSRPTSAFFNYLRPSEGLVRPHSDHSDTESRASQFLMDRMNFKLVKRCKSRARKDVDESAPENDKIHTILEDLRLKIRKMKVNDARRMRNATYNAKQIMTEFSGYGSKVLRRSGNRPLSSGDSSTKELMGIIELVDARLSTSEALAILKEIGINYEPLTAAGKKNATAAALGGLKLGSNDEADPE